MRNIATLFQLLACHSTPGDEAEVRALLERQWRKAGLRVARLGDYAVTATVPRRAMRKPVLLVTAHMDSPGFAVDRLPATGDRKDAAGLTRLGGAAFAGNRAAGVLKTRAGKVPVVIRKHRKPGDECDYACEPAAPLRCLPAELAHGDRVCFACQPVRAGDQIAAPFLDNRLGCWALAELAPQIASWKSRYRIVLGATACEEFGGFGAHVLARHVQPNLVIVVDATYEAAEQNVRLGGGPVLTLSDASVLLSPVRRDQVRAALAAAGVPLQTEVYNFSGTDARAFPHQGLACPVLPLLLATTGNHSPRETADLRDVDSLLAAIACL
jgi:putative aminopeptidase FrvX